MKISYISLGCVKNQVDFENLIGELSFKGLEIESDVTVSDAVIINTCGFIESAVKEAIDTILTISRTMKSDAKLIVSGCMVERYRDDIALELKEVDFFTGVHQLSDITEYLTGSRVDTATDRVITNHPYYAYLKISEGCNNFCTFCTIPKIRGKLKSRSIDNIVTEVSTLVSRDVKEIIIVSQDTTQYHYDIDKKIRLYELLDTLSDKYPTTLFRLLYLNPEGVDVKLIKLISSRANIINYFDIPIQHINDRILKLMNRKSNQQMIRKVISNIREHIPDAFIRSTFIVGFPSESDIEFEELAEFISEGNIDFAGFFGYSDEDIAASFKLADKISAKVIKNRVGRVEKLQKKITLSRLKKMKNTPIEAFIEQVSSESEFILEGRAIFQTPEVDGKLFTIDGVADRGYGPYQVRIKRIIYPDIYVEIL